MSLTQILEELPNLTDQEREELLERLLEWNGISEIEETPTQGAFRRLEHEYSLKDQA